MTQDEWLELGESNGWCSAPACLVHDTPPMTEDEMADYEDDIDVCIYGVRLWNLEQS